MRDTLVRQWYDLCDRWKNFGYARLSRTEKVWFNVRGLIDSIENGGLISYFYNSHADTLDDTLDALSELDATDVRNQVERMMALFPHGVPANIAGRNNVINSWPDTDDMDDLVAEIDDCLEPLMPVLEDRLGAFLSQHGVAT
jgi:hypothetical protein